MSMARIEPTTTELRGQVGSSMWYYATESSYFDINVILGLIMIFSIYVYLHRDSISNFSTPRYIKIMIEFTGLFTSGLLHYTVIIKPNF